MDRRIDHLLSSNNLWGADRWSAYPENRFGASELATILQALWDLGPLQSRTLAKALGAKSASSRLFDRPIQLLARRGLVRYGNDRLWHLTPRARKALAGTP